MSNRNKRKLGHFDPFDPNQSDPEDLDYGASPPPKPQRRSRPSGKSSGQSRPKKRQRYGDSDDDIVDDEDDSVEEDSFDEDESEDDEDVDINPRTGRASRKVTKRAVKYEESSDDGNDLDVEESVERDEDDDNDELGPSPEKARGSKRKSLIVKLKVPSSSSGIMSSSAGARRSSRQTSRGLRGSSEGPSGPSGRPGTRRSSRISRDESEPLVELTTSGRHASVTREGTRSPDPSYARPTRGGKGMKKPPSAIMEASQETSSKEALASFETGMGEPVGAAEENLPDTQPDPEVEGDEEAEEGDVLQSEHEDEEDDDLPVGNRRRSQRSKQDDPVEEQRSTRGSQRKRKGVEESSDFEPGAEEEEKDDDGDSDSDNGKEDTSDSGPTRRGGRLARGRASQRTRHSRAVSDQEDDELDRDELAEEAALLAADRSSKRRSRRTLRDIGLDEPAMGLRNRSNKPDYRLFRPELLKELEQNEEEAANIATPVRNRRGGGGGGGAYRSLFPLAGPFGGHGGPSALFGGPEAAGAVGGADSDSSDDEGIRRRPTVVGGMVGMTPTSGNAPAGLFPQTLNSDPLQGGLGKVKDKKALADADPLGVDQNVTFDGVGGLDDHINKLKEMVALPLLYPEVFQRFHVTPPRGVLFHGPPGTGKTLLARALASSVSSHGKKVTFYMRKGADALSKWVGEAERQLRLLFEEARKNQPSIIFFDEIDGLAPVRSSKQEQIHASIVATLLALMDGMDGRGQVIVIGATNRPDNVDPALRRPGRFDREFYFPLPDEKARRSIISIHTKGWNPPLKPDFKDQLAKLTKGYGGADLRALCTEAALNAVQGTFPQIYSSDKKLVIDPSKINVLAKDFMISVNKMVPSSERAATSSSAPLPKSVEPLLRRQLDQLVKLIGDMIPQKRKLTALEEAQFDDRDDTYGFERETLTQDFDKARIYRPRLLVHGKDGMGQQHLGAALLARLELMHVQSFDLPTIFEDSSTSTEATLVRLFKEVRRHKPSVIFIPNVDVWYNTIGSSVVRTFTSLLRSLPSNDPVLVVGIMETEKDLDIVQRDDRSWAEYEDMMRDLFSFTRKGQYKISRPDEPARREYFSNIITYVRKRPLEFPDPDNRKKRKIEELPVAEEAVTITSPDKEQLKRQRKQDRMTLNLLKIHIQPIMDQIRTKHKKFRTPIVDDSYLGYLYQEQDPANDPTDQQAQQGMYRPYEISKDKHGVQGLREVATNKFFYNLDTVMIEKRLSNGYYKRPRDFLADIKRIAKDARTSGDEDRTIKANEMLANVEVDIQTLLEHGQAALVAECEAVYQREQARERQAKEKMEREAAANNTVPTLVSNLPPPISTTTENTGPVILGEQIPGRPYLPPVTPDRNTTLSNGDTSSYARHSNGSTVPSRPGDDVNMMDVQSADVGPRGETAGQYNPPMGQQSQSQSQSQQRSQTSALQKMAPGSQLADYYNSASTTTSGQKTSDRSHRTSDQSHFGANSNNTQSTNGVGSGMLPDFSMHQGATSGGSELPDTQGETSDSNAAQTSFGSHSSVSIEFPSASQSSQNSQAFPIPPLPGFSRQPTTISSLLNNAEATATPQFILDEQVLGKLHDELVTRSSGLSVEQLEQVNAALMDAMWREKGQWDRRKVIRALEETFNETMGDIEAMQEVLQASQRLLDKQREEEEMRRRSGYTGERFTQGTGGTGSQLISQDR